MVSFTHVNPPERGDERKPPGIDPLDPRFRLSDIEVESLVAKLRRDREPSDETFDALLPPELSHLSGRFWTPLFVIRRIADWLEAEGVGSLVDIGSGVGKFAVALALLRPMRVAGIEHRPHLVQSARRLAAVLGQDAQVTFTEGAFGTDAIPVAEAYYLFNPLWEHRSGHGNRIDDHVSLGEDAFNHEFTALAQHLADAEPGTWVITYNGMGGPLHESYERVRVDRELPHLLCMWRKTSK